MFLNQKWFQSMDGYEVFKKIFSKKTEHPEPCESCKKLWDVIEGYKKQISNQNKRMSSLKRRHTMDQDVIRDLKMQVAGLQYDIDNNSVVS